MGLYRPKFKRKRPDGTSYTYTAPNWRYAFVDPESGRRISGTTHTGDRTAAKLIYAEAVRRAARVHDGTLDRFDQQTQRPLAEHVDDYEQSLRDNERTDQYVVTTVPRIRKALDGCGFVFWRDLSRDRLESFLKRLRDRGIKMQTRNHYATAMRQFVNWMLDTDRAGNDPLRKVRPLKVTDEDERREPTPGELRGIMEAARKGKTAYSVPGVERAALYLTAAATGFRFGECRLLTWRRFELDDDPTVCLKAGESKHRKADWQPLGDDAVAGLRWWYEQQGRPGPDRPVFPHLRGWHRAAKLLRVDMQAADVPYRDDDGLRLVFHSLRDYYVTHVHQQGGDKVAGELGRHTSLRLTRKYSHGIRQDQRDAVNAMPKLWSTDEPQAAQKGA